MDETLKFVEELNLVSRTKAGVYSQLKREMWRETVEYLEGFEAEVKAEDALHEASEIEKEQREQKIKGWEKAKL